MSQHRRFHRRLERKNEEDKQNMYMTRGWERKKPETKISNLTLYVVGNAKWSKNPDRRIHKYQKRNV